MTHETTCMSILFPDNKETERQIGSDYRNHQLSDNVSPKRVGMVYHHSLSYILVIPVCICI